tara:strand:+ start:1581 stop:2444 length:864 start_codon:yes stop_codon:yes gene_type:complete
MRTLKRTRRKRLSKKRGGGRSSRKRIRSRSSKRSKNREKKWGGVGSPRPERLGENTAVDELMNEAQTERDRLRGEFRAAFRDLETEIKRVAVAHESKQARLEKVIKDMPSKIEEELKNKIEEEQKQGMVQYSQKLHVLETGVRQIETQNNKISDMEGRVSKIEHLDKEVQESMDENSQKTDSLMEENSKKMDNLMSRNSQKMKELEGKMEKTFVKKEIFATFREALGIRPLDRSPSQGESPRKSPSPRRNPSRSQDLIQSEKQRLRKRTKRKRPSPRRRHQDESERE